MNSDITKIGILGIGGIGGFVGAPLAKNIKTAKPKSYSFAEAKPKSDSK